MSILILCICVCSRTNGFLESFKKDKLGIIACFGGLGRKAAFCYFIMFVLTPISNMHFRTQPGHQIT